MLDALRGSDKTVWISDEAEHRRFQASVLKKMSFSEMRATFEDFQNSVWEYEEEHGCYPDWAGGYGEEKKYADLDSEDLYALAPDGDLMSALEYDYDQLVAEIAGKEQFHRVRGYMDRRTDITEKYLRENADNPDAPTFAVRCRVENCPTAILGYHARAVDSLSGMVEADKKGLSQSGIPKPAQMPLPAYLRMIEEHADQHGHCGDLDYYFLKECNDISLGRSYYFIFLRAFAQHYDYEKLGDDLLGSCLSDTSKTSKADARKHIAWLMEKHYHNDHDMDMGRGYGTSGGNWENSINLDEAKAHVKEIEHSLDGSR